MDTSLGFDNALFHKTKFNATVSISELVPSKWVLWEQIARHEHLMLHLYLKQMLRQNVNRV